MDPGNDSAINESSQSFEDLKTFFRTASGSDLMEGMGGPSVGKQMCKTPPKTRPPIFPKPNYHGKKTAPLLNSISNGAEENGGKETEECGGDLNCAVGNHNNSSPPKENHNFTNSFEQNGVFTNSTDRNDIEHLEMETAKDHEKDSGNKEIREREDTFDDEDEYDEDDGWDSDEFSCESGSDAEGEVIENKRQSKIIFDKLDGIPDVFILDPRNRKLYNIVREILTTEISYVKTLKLLDDTFFFRLDNELRSKGIIPKEALLEIFSNIKTIHRLHRDFLLPKLEERMTNWHETPKVGDIFNELAPFLKMYAEYVKNFDQAMSTLKKWKLKTQKLAALIDEIQKLEECNCLTLEHHMLGPVQRVPRYKLLLTDYVSKLNDDAEDLEESKKALEIITAAANHANESMKKTERFQKMLEMQEKFPEGTSIITPSREFIMEGELVKISARNAQPMPRIVILFNDSIYCCAKVSATGKYKVKRTAELKNSQVEEAEEEIANRELVFRVHSHRQVTDFQASSVEEKEKWVEALNAAIKSAKDKKDSFKGGSKEVTVLAEDELGKIAPVWVKDTAVSMCMECTMAFTLVKRRHHCRACGKIVCSQCSSYKVALHYDDDKVNRVCSNCFKIITKGEADEKVIRREKSSKRMVYADSVINGYLNYKTENSKTWSKRWCSLGNDFTLHVFRAKKDIKAQTTIPLPGFALKDSTFDEADESGKYKVFKVSHKGYGSFLFDAGDDDTLKSWFSFIGFAIKAETPTPSSATSSVSSPPSTPTPLSPSLPKGY